MCYRYDSTWKNPSARGTKNNRNRNSKRRKDAKVKLMRFQSRGRTYFFRPGYIAGKTEALTSTTDQHFVVRDGVCTKAWLVKGHSVCVVYCIQGFSCPSEQPVLWLPQINKVHTKPTSPSADPLTPDAWQGSHWSANVLPV